MATISRSKTRAGYLLRSSQLRYAAAFILITSVVLVFLNIYAPITIRRLTYSAKRSAILDKTQLIGSSFSSVEKLSEANVSGAVQALSALHTGRVVVTDASARCIYDSLYETTKGKYLAEAQAKKDQLADACKPLLS